MVAQALKERTAHLHDSIEKITLSNKIFDGEFSVEDYKNLVTINGHIVNAFIDNIFTTLPREVASKLVFTPEAKKAAIAKDAADLTLPVATPAIALKQANKAYALGALYVMEGSMLGGNVIAKTLKKYEEFAQHEFNYFTFYKDMLGPNWKSFLGTLMEEVQTEEDIESSVQGAIQVYEELIAKAKTIYNN